MCNKRLNTLFIRYEYANKLPERVPFPDTKPLFSSHITLILCEQKLCSFQMKHAFFENDLFDGLFST